MTPLEINRLCERLIVYRDRQTDRADRDFLADIGDALDRFTKQTRTLAADGRAATEIESLRAALECARDALDLFADEPVETRTAMTEHEHILLATRREVHAALRGRDLSKSPAPPPPSPGNEGGER